MSLKNGKPCKKCGSGIYTIVNKANGNCYIGSAVDVFNRRCVHFWSLRKGNHHNAHLQRAWSKYGEGNFEFIVLEYCDKGALLEREQHHIDTLQPEYNICTMAGNTLGRKFSQEAIEKIRLAHLGKVTSQETRIKLSAVGKGRIITAETRAKMSAAQMGNQKGLGRIVSPEARAKSSASNKNTREKKRLELAIQVNSR